MFQLQRTLLNLAGDLRRPLSGVVAIQLALLVARVATALLTGLVLGAVLDDPASSKAIGALGALAVAMAIRATVAWARERVTQRAGERITATIRNRLAGHLLDLGPFGAGPLRSGEAQATLVDGVEGLNAYYSRYLPQLVVAAIGPPLLVVYVATHSVAVALVLAVAVVSVPLAPRLWDRALRERGKEHWDAYSGLEADYVDAMQGMVTLKALNAASRRRTLLQARADHLGTATIRQMGVSLIDTGLTAIGSTVGSALAIAVAAHQAASGALSVAELAVILMISAECFRPLQELSAQWHAGFLGVSAAGSIETLLDLQPPRVDDPGPDELKIGEDAGEATGKVGRDGRLGGVPLGVDLIGVSATYPGAAAPAVSGIDIEIPAGSITAIVGRSGSGKSTVANLIAGLLPPDQGRITIGGASPGTHDDPSGDGAPSRFGGPDVPPRTACRSAGLVALAHQDPYLFHGTVADNLRLASPEVTDAELWRCLADAAVDDVVLALPDGIGTVIGERGTTLSGGQRQRLALARSLLRAAPVLVLDEPTSALDGATEARVIEALRRRTDSSTVVVVTHRPSTIAAADLVIELEGGAVSRIWRPSTGRTSTEVQPT